jgi:hypothetical protein
LKFWICRIPIPDEFPMGLSEIAHLNYTAIPIIDIQNLNFGHLKFSMARNYYFRYTNSGYADSRIRIFDIQTSDVSELQSNFRYPKFQFCRIYRIRIPVQN